MAMIKCKECGKEISSDAAVCPSCGKRLKIPAWRIVLGILLLIISLGITIPIGYIEIKPVNQNSSVTTSTKNTKNAITKENYEIIIEGMSEEQVKNILGGPKYASTSESPGIGRLTLKHYQETFGKIAIDIYFKDGKVYMKNLTEI